MIGLIEIDVDALIELLNLAESNIVKYHKRATDILKKKRESMRWWHLTRPLKDEIRQAGRRYSWELNRISNIRDSIKKMGGSEKTMLSMEVACWLKPWSENTWSEIGPIRPNPGLHEYL